MKNPPRKIQRKSREPEFSLQNRLSITFVNFGLHDSGEYEKKEKKVLQIQQMKVCRKEEDNLDLCT